jgi:hypothetical protein
LAEVEHEDLGAFASLASVQDAWIDEVRQPDLEQARQRRVVLRSRVDGELLRASVIACR